MFQLEVKAYPQFDGDIDRKILKSVKKNQIYDIFKLILLRERYESASKIQLGKGRAMFEGVIQNKLVELPGWSHLGLVCFTEIENRGVLKEHLPELREEEELKV